MAELWFSSDPHFGHANIIKYCNRPFKNTTEMDETLIERHNALVKPEDHWTCLGDVTMERDNQGRGLEILRRLNGHKRLIGGNHDHYDIKHYIKWFEKVMAMNMIDNIRFTHIPIHPTSMGSAIANVHGHIHDADPPEAVISIDKKTQRITYRPYVNISVERTDYRPVTLGQIKEMIMKSKGEYEGVKVGDIQEGARVG